MKNLLIHVPITDKRYNRFTPQLGIYLLKLGVDPYILQNEILVFVKFDLISTNPEVIESFLNLTDRYAYYFPRLQQVIHYREPSKYNELTNRQARIGMLNHEFNERMDYLLLLDDDMEITNFEYFRKYLINSINKMEKEEINAITSTTHPSKDEYTDKVGWVWMASGMLLRYTDLQFSQECLDSWFFLDDLVIFLETIRNSRSVYLKYLGDNGILHNTKTDAHSKGYIIPEYIHNKYFPQLGTDFNQDYIKSVSEIINSSNFYCNAD